MIKILNSFGSVLQKPDRIIVHAMASQLRVKGELMTAAEFLQYAKLSAHILVTPDGDLIRLRGDSQGAWHAKSHNHNSLGIEFLVPGEHTYGSFLEAMKTDYLTEAAYDAGLGQLREWIDDYDITRVERHSDVDPKRKQDPGEGFPWQGLMDDLALDTL